MHSLFQVWQPLHPLHVVHIIMQRSLPQWHGDHGFNNAFGQSPDPYTWLGRRNVCPCPTTSSACSTCSLCYNFLSVVLLMFARTFDPDPFSPQSQFFLSFIRLLFPYPSHLANDDDSGENTCQENTHCLPCWGSKVGADALLEIIKQMQIFYTCFWGNQEQKLSNVLDSYLPSLLDLWSSWSDFPWGSLWSSWWWFWWCLELESQEPEKK